MRFALAQQGGEGEVRRHWRLVLVPQLVLGRRLVLVQQLVNQKQNQQLLVLALVPVHRVPELLGKEQEQVLLGWVAVQALALPLCRTFSCTPRLCHSRTIRLLWAVDRCRSCRRRSRSVHPDSMSVGAEGVPES
jgi:hypothetical protein